MTTPKCPTPNTTDAAKGGERIDGEFHYAVFQNGCWVFFRKGHDEPIFPAMSKPNSALTVSMYIEGFDETARHFIEQGRQEGRLENQWQPAETAPKDGTDLIVWAEYIVNPVVSYCFGDNDWQGERGNAIGPITHWMPLPTPPSEGGE